MKRCLYEKRNLIDYDTCKALHGLKHLGYEPIQIDTFDTTRPLDKDTILVGYANTPKQIELYQHINLSIMPDYPHEIAPYYERRIKKAKFKDLYENSNETYFVKPIRKGAFKPKIMEFPMQHANVMGYLQLIEQDHENIYIQPPIEILAEFRCFVLNGELLHISQYAGDTIYFDEVSLDFIDIAIEKTEHYEPAYCIDIGIILKDGNFINIVIECNDGYGMGSYGLDPVLYAEMIEAKWNRWCDQKQPERKAMFDNLTQL